MSALTWIITILGFVATIIGSILVIATYISPSWRLKHYIKKKVKIGEKLTLVE